MDYVKQSTLFKVRKVLRYVSLYGVSRTYRKVLGQLHVRRQYQTLPQNFNRASGNEFIGLIGCGNFAFTTIALIVADFRVNYPEVGNVSTSYESQYNYVTNVNSSFLDISSDLEKIGEEESGWKRILGGLLVFAKGIIVTLLAVITSIPYLTSILAGISSELGVPTQIIAIGLVSLFASIIIMLIKFLHRSTI